MIHYHCADIHPTTKLLDLAGRHLLVSFAYPRQVETAHAIAQSVLLDNGAFTTWRQGRVMDWGAFYGWADRWLDHPTTWAIIPDVIEGEAEVQDALVAEWPHGQRGAPVWHMHEPIDRLLRLVDGWPRTCIGSSREFAVVGAPPLAQQDDRGVQRHRPAEPTLALAARSQDAGGQRRLPIRVGR